MTTAEEILAALSGANVIDEFEMLTPQEQFDYLQAIDRAEDADERTALIEDMCAELADKARP